MNRVRSPLVSATTIALVTLAVCLTAAAQSEVPGSLCGFNSSTLKFRGDTALAQAKCLLRPVTKGGELGEMPATLPEPLESLIGRPVTNGGDDLLRFKQKLGSYLDRNHIPRSAVGGPIQEPLARANNNDSKFPFVGYFVIHDTSTPNLCEEAQFPTDINDLSWIWGNWQIRRTRWNNVTRYRNAKEAHMYVTRNGDSTNAQHRTFATPWRATKLEKVVGIKSKGLFIHIENVQPRRFEDTGSEPPSTPRQPNPHYYKLEKGKWKCRNDRLAPALGFSDAHLDRLALIYIAASARRGEWLIPAFHATVDAGLSGGHDDPQNFDLNRWAQRLASLLELLRQ